MGPDSDGWGMEKYHITKMEDCGEGPGWAREGAVRKLRKDRCTEESAKAGGSIGGLNAKEPELYSSFRGG